MEQSNDKIYKNRMLILLNLVLMTFMSTLDTSIVNVALPRMAENLSVTTAAISWIVTSYFIAVVGSILIFGRLGDLKGNSLIFKYGVLLFTGGSLLCAVVDSLFLLIIARVLQGIGASATIATTLGIIVQVFPSNERGKSLGIIGTFAAFGNMAGPPLGGFIIDVVSWKYIFLINIPVGIFVYIMGMKLLPRSPEHSKGNLDWIGAALFAVISISMFGSLIIGEDAGYSNPLILAGFAIGVICLIIFIKIEKKTEDPLIQLKIFKNKLFTLSITCTFLLYVGVNCLNIIQPFFLQNVMNYSPSYTGMIILVGPALISITAPFSGYLSDKIGSEFLTFLGLSLTCTGLFLMSGVNGQSQLSSYIIFLVIISTGHGLFQSPNTSLIMSNAPANMSGIAGSINALTRYLGMITGVSLGVTLLYSFMSAKMGYQISDYIPGREDVFIYGMKWVYFTAAFICAVGALLTAIRLYNRKKRLKEMSTK